MSHQAFFDALHEAQVRLREERQRLADEFDRDFLNGREDDEGDELAEREGQ